MSCQDYLTAASTCARRKSFHDRIAEKLARDAAWREGPATRGTE